MKGAETLFTKLTSRSLRNIPQKVCGCNYIELKFLGQISNNNNNSSNNNNKADEKQNWQVKVCVPHKREKNGFAY